MTGLSPQALRARINNGHLDDDELSKQVKQRNVSHIGERHGMLTILSERKIGNVLFVDCKCDCGNLCEKRYTNLLRYDFHSCGCTRNSAGTHFMSKSKEHKAWRHIKSRCLNPNDKSFPNYGGRGIMICDRWRYSFEAFYEDMGPAPSSSHSIDRIDPNGDYRPDNCRWVTWDTQCRNKRHTIKCSYMGIERPLSEWSRSLGIKYGTLKAAFLRGENLDKYIPSLLEKLKRR